MRFAALLPIAVALALLGLFAGASRASFPGVSGQIAAAENGIRAFDPDGANSHLLYTATTPTPCFPCAFGAERTPAWSPDGTLVVFEEQVQVETMAVAQGIAVVDANGSNFRSLTQNGGSGAVRDREPRWSPDGQRVVFERAEGASSTLVSVGAAGGSVTPVTSGARSDHDPDWSPDGSKIAFSTGGQIHAINPNGTGEAPLTAGTDDADPSWSPDGTRLLFVRGGRLWMMNANGSNQHQVVVTDGVRSPSWSPDGLKAAFSVLVGETGTYVLDLAGSSPTRISGGLDPDWGTHPVTGPPPTSTTTSTTFPTTTTTTTTTTTPPPPAADLWASGSVAPRKPLAGTVVRLIFTVGNAGPSEARDVKVTTSLRAGPQRRGTFSSLGSCRNAVCRLGALPPGKRVVVTVLVKASKPGRLTGSAIIAAPTTDPVAANNRAQAAVTVAPRCTITGTGRADVIRGTGHADRICALGGNDRVHAREGARDHVDCGAGRDVAILDARDTQVRCETVSRRG